MTDNILTYVMSDLHGCYDKYIKMLEIIKFSDNDMLYILGDIVDRGNDGIKILSDLKNRKNVIITRGNHDYQAYKILKFYYESTETKFSKNYLEIVKLWLSDGGKPTFEQFCNLTDNQKKEILKFMSTFSYFEETTVNGIQYFLAHTVPEKDIFLNLDACKLTDFIIGEPEYEKTYKNDLVIVTGHTPTGLIDEKYSGKIWKGNNHIAIDCGAVFGNNLGCLRLNDGAEFYC